MTISAANSLASYIVDDLFDWFMQERRNLFEDQWRRNDDAFRGRYDSESLKKWKATEGTGWRSQVFVRLTKQKVVTGYTNLMAVALQNGRLPYDIQPTPIPETQKGFFLPEPEAKMRANRMRQVIRDDLDVCKAERSYMTSCMELALQGISWIRGPVLRPRKVVTRSMTMPGFPFEPTPELMAQYGRYDMQVRTELRPVMEGLSLWNVFWDLETADHQDGHGVVIREMMSYGRFLDLAGAPGYDGEAIQSVIEQFREEDAGENDQSHGPYAETLSKRRRCITTYEFFGRVPRRYLEQYGGKSMDMGAEGFRGGKEVEIHCVLAKGKSNPVVIQPPVANPLYYRPVYKSVWEEIPNEAGGIGIPENMQDSQMMINSLTRAMLDNKSLSSNLLMKWNSRFMAPGQNKVLYPGKTFETAEHVEDLRQAIDFFAPPDVTGNTPEIINMFERWADEETGLPKILQGETARHQPDTAFEMSKLVEAANKSIASTVKNCDEGQIEPLITGFYDWHFLTNPDESIKGDYQVIAKGFDSYRDKAVRAQDLLSLAQFAMSNQLAAQYTKVMEIVRELARIRDVDPDRFFMTDDEIQAQMQMQTMAMAAAMDAQAMAEGGQPMLPAGGPEGGPMP